MRFATRQERKGRGPVLHAFAKALNWVVETWFPDTAFVGGKYLDVLDKLDQKVPTKAVSMYLLKKAIDMNAEKIVVNITGYADQDRDMGDWRLTLENIHPGADFPRKLNAPAAKRIIETRTEWRRDTDEVTVMDMTVDDLRNEKEASE